ncbi:uncharacterized protein Z520_01749 [Fonsecaea multimorphosa CBS 102226]|uniref:Rad51-like C-terminal domain-containing protein n=1 Tax=Fonsecaea multimorphosa CBS 102226 TaxID=1442371 RepID=A0A0D2J1M0_9EURO|nr:uncharacterized protein Z520_01749 [Fonsecaea multimorphosa CBS 102226]KIY03282.1 hypothetical protein Z520_01749 [Fonsecaea multimorphosa CBS 102226]OAL30201.1 hypothetical protein AYO22_01717 [Fonsecaea multimorphosa]
MSAEQYGARLLEEVHEESLEQFLAELRCTVNPRPRSVLGVSQLDSLLESLRYPATQDTLQRQGAWPSSPAAASPVLDEEDRGDDEVSNSRGPQERTPTVKPKPATIELTSVRSASGKTSLLSHLCAVSVLPRSLGGKESTAVYVDADGRFSATRVAQMMQHYLQTHHHQQSSQAAAPGTTLTDANVQQQTIIRSSLDHIHVFRPQSSAQMISILSSLDTYLLDSSKHHSMHRPLGLIVIDSATAFYWQDRGDQAMAKLEAPATANPGGPSRAAETITHLKTLQERFDCAVLVSTTSPTPPSSHQFPSTSTRPLNEPSTTSVPTALAPLVSPWTSYATLSLSLARLPVPQFPAKMGLDECLRDRDKRLEAVRKGRFVATLLPSSAAAANVCAGNVGSESGRGGGKGGRSAFGFGITTAGVEFE